jgi:hypothetical protein
MPIQPCKKSALTSRGDIGIPIESIKTQDFLHSLGEYCGVSAFIDARREVAMHTKRALKIYWAASVCGSAAFLLITGSVQKHSIASTYDRTVLAVEGATLAAAVSTLATVNEAIFGKNTMVVRIYKLGLGIACVYSVIRGFSYMELLSGAFLGLYMCQTLLMFLMVLLYRAWRQETADA